MSKNINEYFFQGVRLKGGNTEFVVYAPKAQNMQLCLFSDDEKIETKIVMKKDEKGRRYDDDFFIMVSGNDVDMEVKLPDMPNKGHWRLVFDTSKYCLDNDNKEYKKGDTYVIKPHAMVVLVNKRIEPKEKQIVAAMINDKLKLR